LAWAEDEDEARVVASNVLGSTGPEHDEPDDSDYTYLEWEVAAGSGTIGRPARAMAHDRD
jgi:hypothetical protein